MYSEINAYVLITWRNKVLRNNYSTKTCWASPRGVTTKVGRLLVSPPPASLPFTPYSTFCCCNRIIDQCFENKFTKPYTPQDEWSGPGRPRTVFVAAGREMKENQCKQTCINVRETSLMLAVGLLSFLYSFVQFDFLFIIIIIMI